MLCFVGLGLDQSVSLVALKVLQNCDYIYYESYTSPVVNTKIEDEIGKSVERVKRSFVEDGHKILELARYSNVALLCSGDPLVATTHQELRTRATGKGIETRVIHGSSVLTAVVGELGLHAYNVGRIVTMTRDPMQYTAYNTIFKNLLQGLHTIVLLEWDEASEFFLSPDSAVKSLLEAEKDIRNGVLNNDTLMLVASRLGTEKAAISATTFGEIDTVEFGKPPHTLMIPGRLHFTEREALGALLKRSADSLRDNSGALADLSNLMVTKYSQKTLNALGRAKKAATLARRDSSLADVFENVECYTQDARRFLNEGKKELAVLSIGYAEGLLDSLRFTKQLEFEW